MIPPQIGHNVPSFDDIIEENLRVGMLLCQRDVLIRSLRDPRLNHRHRIVLAAIVEFMNTKTAVAYPGRAAIAKKTVYYDADWIEQNYSQSTVAKTIAELVEYGYLIMERRTPEGRKHFLAHYTLARPDHEELQREIEAYIRGVRAAGRKGKPALKVVSNVTPCGNVDTGGNVTPPGNVTGAALDIQDFGNVTTGVPANVTTGVPTVTSIGTVDSKGVEFDASEPPPEDFGFDGERISFSHEAVCAYKLDYPELEYPRDLRATERAVSRSLPESASRSEYARAVAKAVEKKALEFRALAKQVHAVAQAKAEREASASCYIRNGRLYVANGFEADLLREFAEGDAVNLREQLDRVGQYVPPKAVGEQLMLAVRSQLSKQRQWAAQDGGRRATASSAAGNMVKMAERVLSERGGRA